ncbi:hypothetical protein ACFU7T_25355 [Streptomyces sp. NPDC057555]|uniref:hypothetical protein n=1 Tax=Streptomyces sp. NPDC057555 TaxID=3346166 RepID=UPI00369CCEC6
MSKHTREPKINGKNNAHCRSDDSEVIRQHDRKRTLLARMRDRIRAKSPASAPKTPAR